MSLRERPRKWVVFIIFILLVILSCSFWIPKSVFFKGQDISQSEKVRSEESQISAGSKVLDINNAESFFKSLDCGEISIFYGNPNYWDSAIGANCIFDGGKAVVIRVFSQNSVNKILPDWGELITSENQLVYSDSWFATGDREILEDIFKDYSYINLGTSLPKPEGISEKELDISICSSAVYFIVEKIALGDNVESEISQYSAHYPKIESIISDIGKDMKRDNFRVNFDSDYEYKVLEYSSRYDKEIKNSCSSLL